MSRSFMRWYLLLLLIAAPKVQGDAACADTRDRSCMQAASTPADHRYLFWRVSAPGSTVYLLGSVHFGRPEMYPLAEKVTQAFDQADALVVEANVLAIEPEQVAQWLASKAMYQDGSTLEQNLPAETWRRSVETADNLGLPAQLLSRQKPWFVSMSLSALAMKRYGYSDELGIDRYFLQAAQGKKKIVELESVQQQLEFFEKFSDREQAAMLARTLSDIARGPAFLTDVLNAWQTGSDTRLDALLNDEFRRDAAARRAYQVLLLDRNVTMTDKIVALMKNGGAYFVVVGAGHLVGERGIVGLLRKRSYRIDRP